MFEIVLSGGEGGVTELEEGDRLGDVLEPVLAGLLQGDVDQCQRDHGETTTCPPWPELMIRAAVCTSIPSVFGGMEAGDARMDPDADRDGPYLETCHCLGARRDGIGRCGKRLKKASPS